MNRMAPMEETWMSDGLDVLDSRGFGDLGMSRAARRITVTTWLMLLALIVVLSGCKKAEEPSQTTFASPDDAGNGLLSAVKTGDINAVLPIFGADSKDVISSGDPVQDKAVVGAFVAGYGQMHRWRMMPDGSEILLIGADNFPFPIPRKRMPPASGSSTQPLGKMRFYGAASAGMNWRLSIPLTHWAMLKPTTIHGFRAVPSNTRLSSSVIRARRTACIGSRRPVNPKARSDRSWRLQRRKDIAQSPLRISRSMVTTTAC